MGTATASYRYPVKSMLGEAVIAVAVTERGHDGDRVYAVLDESGAVGSVEHPWKWGANSPSTCSTCETSPDDPSKSEPLRGGHIGDHAL
ncbi:MOSC N-terminal beta barrel domain-containing protein [Streptomyces mirabilis]|uniref:MOSC N-terminal beta barrel domain-containing protein n=1 Tax=Streptomyces mirabilis TaxID=68239 RepID=UPI0036ADBA80